MLGYVASLSLAQGDIPAQFPGGNNAYYQFMNENLKYPETALASEADRTVKVIVNIEADGKASILDFVFAKSGLGFEEEVSRFINLMPKWKPALYGGVPSPSQVVLTFDFKYSHQNEDDEEEGADEAESYDLKFYESSDIPPFFEFGVDSLNLAVQQAILENTGQSPSKSTCTLEFIVDTSGRLLNVSILENTGQIEAKVWIYALVNAGTWQPGIVRGRKVNVRYTHMFSFR